MIIEKLKHRKDRLIESIEKADLSVKEKEDYIDLINSSFEGTNGLTKEEKLQSVSESVFNITSLVISNSINKKKSSWKDVLISCKREILWLGITICVLLSFRPEIADIISQNI